MAFVRNKRSVHPWVVAVADKAVVARAALLLDKAVAAVVDKVAVDKVAVDKVAADLVAEAYFDFNAVGQKTTEFSQSHRDNPFYMHGDGLCSVLENWTTRF